MDHAERDREATRKIEALDEELKALDQNAPDYEARAAVIRKLREEVLEAQIVDAFKQAPLDKPLYIHWRPKFK